MGVTVDVLGRKGQSRRPVSASRTYTKISPFNFSIQDPPLLRLTSESRCRCVGASREALEYVQTWLEE